MPIRTIKKACLLDSKERFAFQKETGSYPSACIVDFNFITNEPKLRITEKENCHLGLYYIAQDELTHEGMVVGFETETVRVMSDVWEEFRYAVVYEPNGPVGPGAENVKNPEMFRRVHIPANWASTHEQDYVFAMVDASNEIKEIYEAWKAGKRWADRHERRRAAEAKAIRDAEIERQTVRKGKWVEVTRGRKVPQGTKGLVFWLNDSKWGVKVGIALPNEDGTFETEPREARNGRIYDSYKNIAWTYAKNCDVIEAPEVVENIQKKAA